MDDAIDSDFGASAEMCPMEHGRSGRDEHLILDCAAHQMGVRSDQTMVANLC
jgi:hypothetical protein